MKKKKLSRQLLSGMLAFSLGFTSMANIALANDKSDSEWKKVDKEVPLDRVHKVNPDLKETNHSAKDEVRTLIVLDGKSASECGYLKKSAVNSILLNNHMNKLEAQQEEMSEKISEEVLDGEELDVRYNFTVLTNAMSANVTYEDVEKIREVDGVKDVYVLPQYSPQVVQEANPHTITSGEMVGSYNTWQLGYSGEGMRIAIIDTGLDMDHPSFNGEAFTQALSEKAAEEGKNVSDYDLLDKEDIAAVIDQLNATAMYAENGGEATAKDFYRNAKVPFAFSYIDQDMDVTHDYDKKGDHGTHVAGISTANKYVKTEDGFVKQKEGVVGIAPNAQLFVMKVFGNNGGAYSDDYMAAIQDALLLGVDAINLSLGSANGGESVETNEAEAYINEIMEQLEKTNTVVSMSAGNAGAWSDYSTLGGLDPQDVSLHTVGSPGSYTNSFTVASADNAGATGYAFGVGEKQFYFTESNEYGNKPFVSLDTTGEGTELEYVFIDGIGKKEDYEGIDVTGKIVFVSRGETSFYEKHIVAAEQGAIACVIYNNQPGIIGLNLTGTTTTIPCVSIKQAEGMAIKEASTQQGKAYVGKMSVYSEITSSYDPETKVQMSDFSSWGVSGDLSLKPEITAPGGNIYSTLDKGQYGLMSGTSMAAPSVAGMSALVIQYIEDLKLDEKMGLSSRVLAQSLLMSTANVVEEEEGVPYSPRKQGAGLADVENAVTTPVTILMDDDGKVKAELGDDPARTGEYSFTFTLVNLTDEKQYYSFDSKVTTEKLVDGLVVGSSKLLNPTVEFSNTTLDYDLNNDGSVDKLDAMIFLKHVNNSEECALITEDEVKYDFNEDGLLTTLDVHIYLTKIENDEFTNRFIVVDDKTEVTVTIKLSEEDKQYLDTTFVNGMYVDGFVTLDGNIDLSIPFLAYYGDWNDPSMFEHVSLVDGLDVGGEDYSYSYTFMTNAFVDGEGYILGGNPFVEEDEYLEERNAISSETNVLGVVYTLIRNASKVTVTVSNAETGEIYKLVDAGDQLAEFYHENAQAWMNTELSEFLGWNVTDAEGNPLPEGTKVNLSVNAYTAYNAESEKEGKGTTLTYPFTVDNTAPTIKEITTKDGVISVTSQDNEYVAAIVLIDRENNETYIPVNQTVKGAEITTEIPMDGKVYYVLVTDYAGNYEVYGRVNNTEDEYTDYASGVSVTPETLTLYEGHSTTLTAYAQPETLNNTDVVWESSDESVVVVEADGTVTALKEGSATITATTVATNEEGIHFSDTCVVTVEINSDFTGLVVDFTSKTPFNWGSFTAKNLKSETLVQNEGYYSAVRWDEYLLGIQVGSNEMIAMDPDTYQPLGSFGSLGNEYLTDMSVGGSTNLLAGTYQSSVMWFDLETGTSFGFDFIEDFGIETYASGVTYTATVKIPDRGIFEEYVISTVTGELYFVYIGVDNDSILLDGPVKIMNKETSFELSSLYFDENSYRLYWSAFDGQKSDMYTINYMTGDVQYMSSSKIGTAYYGLLNPNTVGQDIFVRDAELTNIIGEIEKGSSKLSMLQNVELKSSNLGGKD